MSYKVETRLEIREDQNKRNIIRKFYNILGTFAKDNNILIYTGIQKSSKIKYKEAHHINAILYAANKYNLTTEVVIEIINIFHFIGIHLYT